MGTLQLSFHGPYLYRFASKQVEIYAPKCPGHTAAIYTAKNESPLTGRHRNGNERTFRLTGPVFTASPVTPTFYDPDQTILNVPSTAKPAFERAYFCIYVPVPQTVVPTLANDVEIVDNTTTPPGKPTGVLSRKATGFRFYYSADLSKSLALVVNEGPSPSWMSDFDAPALGHDFADAEIRYGRVGAEEFEHQDAYECFDRTAELAGLDWWLSYDDRTKPLGAEPYIKGGADCRGPLLVIR